MRPACLLGIAIGLAALTAAATARSVSLYACWYTAAGVFLTCNSTPSVTETAGSWGTSPVAATATAPATAARAALLPLVTGAAAGETHYVDGVALLATPPGTPARLYTISDRRGTVTTFGYDDQQSKSTSTTPNGLPGAGQIHEFVGIDAAGRVAETRRDDDAAVPNTFHDGLYSWDRPGAACRAPDGTYAGAVKADGPSGYWRLGDTSGTTAIDSSGSGFNGVYTGGFTLNQAGAAPNDPDKAVSFNGTSGRVQLSNTAGNFERTNPFSLETWVKTTSTGAVMLIAKMDNAAPYRGYDVYLNGGTVGFQMINDYAALNYMQVHGATTVNDGGWHHVVVTSTGTSTAAGVTIYVDGRADPTLVDGPADRDTLTGTVLTTAPLSLGARSSGGFWLPGSLDEVAAYPSALLADRVAVHYRGGPVDNNLCRVVHQPLPGATTPAEDTAFTFNAEGGLIAAHQANGTEAIDTTFGYEAQYVQTDNTVTQASDTPIGSGEVASTARPVGRAAASTRYYLVDHTATLTPQGNHAPPSGSCTGTGGWGYACYLTTYLIDNAPGDPNAVPPGGSCVTVDASNTGNVCEIDAPAFAAPRATNPATTATPPASAPTPPSRGSVSFLANACGKPAP